MEHNLNNLEQEKKQNDMYDISMPLSRCEFLKQRNQEIAKALYTLRMEYAKKRDFAQEMVRNFDEMLRIEQDEEHQRINEKGNSFFNARSQPVGY